MSSWIPKAYTTGGSASRRQGERESMGRYRVLIADSHTLVRRGLRCLLADEPDFTVVGEARDGGEALECAQRERPDVVIMDIGMPVLSGIEVTRRISRNLPDTRVVILTAHSDESYVLQALRVGAVAFVLKSAGDQDIAGAVRAAAENRAFFSSGLKHIMAGDYLRHLQREQVEDGYELLTGRERQIFQLLAEGQSNKQIAGILDLSPTTVACHRQHMFQKLNLHNLHDLMVYAIRRGMIPLHKSNGVTVSAREEKEAAGGTNGGLRPAPAMR